MPALLNKRDSKHIEPVDLFSRFDRMFDHWVQAFPFPRPFSLVGMEWMREDLIRVDEYHEDGVLVVKAEMPGIDPDKDVELTVSDHVLHIAAVRREEEKTEEKGYVRQEIRSGSFGRALALPPGVTESDITATYENGILEIRIPAPEPATTTTIPITTS
jgi:HSP20 family protein